MIELGSIGRYHLTSAPEAVQPPNGPAHGFSSQPWEGFAPAQLELSMESEEALSEDLSLITAEFAMWELEVSGARRNLRCARAGLIAAARAVQVARPELWSIDVAAKLADALQLADQRLSGVRAWEDPDFGAQEKEINRLAELAETIRLDGLQTTFYQHEVDMQKCSTVSAGWAGVACCLYVPWIVTIYAYLRMGLPGCSDARKQYLFGFVIALLLNLALNYFVSCVPSVDRGNTCFARYGKYVVRLCSLVIVMYNIWGVTLIWSPQVNANDCALDPLILAVVVVFLVLPCSCLIIRTALDRILGPPAQR
jgi:hypothetical protein